MVTCFQQALTEGRGLHLKNTVRGFLRPGIRGFYLLQNAPHFLAQILGRRGRASKVSPKACHALRLSAWTQGPQERLPAGSLLPHPILGPVDLMALPVPCFLFLRELRTQNPPDPTMFRIQPCSVSPPCNCRRCCLSPGLGLTVSASWTLLFQDSMWHSPGHPPLAAGTFQ